MAGPFLRPLLTDIPVFAAGLEWQQEGPVPPAAQPPAPRGQAGVSEPPCPRPSIVTMEEPAFAEHLLCDRYCLEYVSHLTLVTVPKQMLFLAPF